MSLGLAVTVITLIISVGAGALVIGGNFRIGHNTAIVNRYRDIAQSWEGKATVLEDKCADLGRQNAEQARKIATMEGEIETLRDMVTSRSAVEKLAASFTETAATWTPKIAEALALLGASQAELKSIHSKINKLAGRLDEQP